jgi:ABC-type multidrug transport system fused ATPase/permease subunit
MNSLDLIKQYVQENKGLIAAYFIVNIITLFLETIVLSHISSSLFVAFQGSSNNLDHVKKLIFSFILTFILVKVGYSIRNSLYDTIIPSFNKFTKVYLYTEIINRYKIDYKELNLGFVQYNFQNLPYHLNRLVIELLQEYIPNTIAILICSFYLTYLFPYSGIAAILGVVLITVVILTRFKGSLDRSHKEHNLAQYASEYIQDKLNNLFNIYVSGTDDSEINDYKELEEDLKEKSYENYSYNTQTVVIVEIISICVTISVLILVLKNFKTSITISSAILVIIVLTHYTGYLTKMANNLVSLVDIIGYLDQANKFIQEITTVVNNEKTSPQQLSNLSNLSSPSSPSSPSSLQMLSGSIEFNNINFGYNNNNNNNNNDYDNNNNKGSLILNNFNLCINQGQKIAIYGKSGSGKSTIIKLLLGFYEPNSGTITIGNTSIKDVPVEVLRKSIAVMGQNVKLFDKNIIENIVYGSDSEVSVNDALEILKSYGSLPALSIICPEATGDLFNACLNKSAGVNGSNLSGGQKQVVNFLRTLLQAHNKSIIILDEPTSALDKATKNVVLDVIKNLRKTVIVVTHDSEVSKYVDFIHNL